MFGTELFCIPQEKFYSFFAKSLLVFVIVFTNKLFNFIFLDLPHMFEWFCLHVCICTVYVLGPQRSEVCVKYPET